MRAVILPGPFFQGIPEICFHESWGIQAEVYKVMAIVSKSVYRSPPPVNAEAGTLLRF